MVGVQGDDFGAFVLRGDVQKQYEVLEIQPGGEKVLGRKPGVTVDVCVAAYPEELDPRVVQEGPTAHCAQRKRVAAPSDGDGAARRAVEAAGSGACREACGRAMGQYLTFEEARTGLPPSRDASSEVVEQCRARCVDDVAKTGLVRQFALRLKHP